MANRRPQSRSEEFVNALIHGSGLLASLGAAPFLLWAAGTSGSTRQVVACAIFAATLVLLYASSTLYHALRPSRAKQLLRTIDHIAIYLLIAGTATPFALGVLGGPWGWTLFGLLWGLAVLGILYKVLFGFRFPRFSTLMYLGMGWLGVLALGPLSREVPLAGLAWLLAGGLCYTAGVLFYHRDHLPYRHAAWHILVLAGSGCHYAAILGYATGRHG
jgi:hemolysin III